GYQVHRGALASMARRPLPGVGDVVAGHDKILVLEDLVDHGNVGAIFRCAAALGVGAVVLAPRCADPLYRRAGKVSMGAVFAIPYARMNDWDGGPPGGRGGGGAAPPVRGSALPAGGQGVDGRGLRHPLRADDRLVRRPRRAARGRLPAPCPRSPTVCGGPSRG